KQQQKWSLPLPNTYTYSLVISSCARCHQGEVALSLLDQMTEMSVLSMVVDDDTTTTSGNGDNGDGDASSSSAAAALPDTVTYNTVLSVIDEHSFMAVKNKEALLSSSSSERGDENTATTTATTTTRHHRHHRYLSEHEKIVNVVLDILNSMEERGVSRDAITYYNAIMACRSKNNCDDALLILRKAFSDSDFIQAATTTMMSNNNNNNNNGGEIAEEASSPSHLKGRAATGLVFVANAALSIAAKYGDIHAVTTVLSMLSKTRNNCNSTKLNSESIKHIIRTLGKIHDCEAILALLICLRGQDFANDILKERYSIDILSNMSEKSIPMIEEEVYSAAITSCLRHDELGMADQILSSMKKNGLTLNQRSLKEIIAEYCRMAMTSSKDEFKVARLAKRQEADTSRYGIVEPIYITSRARAKAALTMLRAVEKPVPPSLLSPVAKACCAAGLWQDARSILRRMHRAAIHELRQGNYYGSPPLSSSSLSSPRRAGGKFLDELPRLHRSLLKFCAKGGNITPALNFADDIQFLASQIRQHGKSLRGTMVKIEEEETEQPELITLSSRLLMDIPTPDNIPETDFSNAGALSNMLERPAGLTGQDWKLILIAASRGGHWKVCVGTLPFIRPYVKETHPMYARESYAQTSGGDLSPSRPSLERLNRKYDRIARALTAAILCFEARSQYAWAIRAIDDWIEWSGRRPRKEAVASACRVLAKRYRGQEVLTLVSKVMNIPATDNFDNDGLEYDDESELSDYTYGKAIYTESINALHKSGLYEEADQLYAEGISNGHLPWAVVGSDKKQLRLDLHGMSAAVAHSAVRVSLQREIMGSHQPIISSDGATWSKDVMIITGRGRRSGERFRPILRPEVQRMLTEEFYPPLGTSSIRGNMGALLVPSEDIKAWLGHQQQQKGDRLLFVADMLRDISSGNRLEKALLSSGKSRIEKALRMKFNKLENSGLAENDDDDDEQ
ncbi:hypothetical protein ACHAXR_012024, partial [Thalassiosira sp. AJA248-18]